MCGLAQQNISITRIRLEYNLNRFVKTKLLFRIREKVIHHLFKMRKISSCVIYTIVHAY